MNPEEYLARIESPAGKRYDVSRLFHDAATFDALVADLTDPFDPEEADLVAGIDALGFVIGSAVARELGLGFVPVRKGGKLPIREESKLSRTLVDYSGREKTLELDRAALPTGARVLVVDDWVETAAQMTAAVELIEEAGGVVAGIATVGADAGPTEGLAETYRFHRVLPRR